MKQWLLSVTAASILSAVALALCPEGRVRTVTRLVCGIVCALALISPVMTVDLTELSAAMAAYGQNARLITEKEEEERKMLERTYIEEQCAAYILNTAAAMGLTPDSVTVTARWDEADAVWYPYEAVIALPENAALARTIEAELGIPRERQTWSAP